MAWTAPPTFVSGAVLTAAQLNILSADLNETGAAKATAGGQLIVSSAANTLTTRVPTYAVTEAAETTTSVASYGDLATVGPAVTVTVTASAIYAFSAQVSNATAGAGGFISFALTGATTFAAPNGHVMRAMSGIAGEANEYSKVGYQSAINAGSNTFTLKYTTPTGGTASFQFRDLLVIPL